MAKSEIDVLSFMIEAAQENRARRTKGSHAGDFSAALNAHFPRHSPPAAMIWRFANFVLWAQKFSSQTPKT